MKHVTMELGGKSPLIVFDDADLENAVSAAINANFYSLGQVCSNGTRVFVQKGIRDAFLDRLCARLEGRVMGDPLDEAVNFGPMVSSGSCRSCSATSPRAWRRRAAGPGGKRLDRPGCFIEPTVFADVTDDMTIAREEIFGPVMAVLDFDEEDEVVARANATESACRRACFTRDVTRAHRVIRRLRRAPASSTATT
jgi:betaine-aldehyde dehydrogenase